MKLRANKTTSLFFYLFVYCFAFTIGIFVTKVFTTDTTSLWISSLVFDLVSTIIVWLVGLMIKNPSIYDPYWSVLPPVMLLYWFAVGNIGFTVVNSLILFTVLFWSVRLTYNFILNFDGMEYQDWRYVMLKAKNPKIWGITNFFGINLMPTVIVFIQLLSTIQIIGFEGKLSIGFILGAIISISSAVLQYIADKQMREFRLLHREHKACMRSGIWAYSRHPNYFGEVSFWWGLWVMYFGITGSLDLYLISPILMTMLFMFISIPMMEKKILSSRPEYRDIQDSISVFIPFFPKKSR